MDLELLPRPPKPALYTVLGHKTIIPYALRGLAVTFTPENRILWVDACNQFNVHWIAQSARVDHKDSKEVLRAFKYARPFTAFQLETMVSEKLGPALLTHHALFAVIADPLSLYDEAEEEGYSIRQSFDLFTNALRALTRERAVLLLIPDPKPSLYYRRLIQLSNQVTELWEERYPQLSS